MLPVLIDLKFLKIYTSGIFLVLAFFWSSYLLWRNIRLTSYKEEDIFDGVFIGILGALIFGRLVYVILDFKEFGFDLLKFILINGYPGFSLFGVLIGGLVTLYLFLLVKKIKFSEAIDYFISPLFMALALGKLGDFFSGAEVGTQTKFFLSIKYAGFDGLRHLTAIYESLFFFLAAYIAYNILFQIRRDRYSKGFLFYFFWWYTGLIYFVFDKFKVNRLYFFGQSFSSRVALLIFLTTTLYFLYYFRNLIGKKLAVISSSIRSNGHKNFKKISIRPKREAGGNPKTHHKSD